MSRRATARPRLRVSISSDRPTRATSGLAAFLETAAPRGAAGTVEVAIITNARMRALNARFRGVSKPTDVLSFPDADVSSGRKSSVINCLGGIAIAIDVARRQASERRHTLTTEVRILALHGLLHLLGYDHERDQGEMRRIEERLRRRAGLIEGLITRSRS